MHTCILSFFFHQGKHCEHVTVRIFRHFLQHGGRGDTVRHSSDHSSGEYLYIKACEYLYIKSYEYTVRITAVVSVCVSMFFCVWPSESHEAPRQLVFLMIYYWLHVRKCVTFMRALLTPVHGLVCRAWSTTSSRAKSKILLLSSAVHQVRNRTHLQLLFSWKALNRHGCLLRLKILSSIHADPRPERNVLQVDGLGLAGAGCPRFSCLNN